MPFNPSRLAVARRRRGLTKRGLADAAGLGERTIIAYERSDRTPSDEMVRHLASVLGFPASFFYRADIEQIAEEVASFRKMSKMSAAQRERALAGGELALELNAWIVGPGRFVLPAPDIPDLRYHDDPEAAADGLRARWALGDSPISNMVSLLEAKGVRVFSLAEESREIDAFSFWRGSQPFVFLNVAKAAERSRFDAAHELGHLVLHQHGQPNGRAAEREADIFASAFLMTASSITAFAPRIATVERLIRAKRHWKVSVSALARRIHHVGMMSDWQYRQLAKQMSTLGYFKSEPESMPREMSQVFRKVFKDLRAEGIGRPELARALDWPVPELDALVFQLVVSPINGGGGQSERRAGSRIAQVKVV